MEAFFTTPSKDFVRSSLAANRPALQGFGRGGRVASAQAKRADRPNKTSAFICACPVGLNDRTGVRLWPILSKGWK